MPSVLAAQLLMLHHYGTCTANLAIHYPQELIDELRDTSKLWQRGEAWTAAQLLAIGLVVLRPIQLTVSSSKRAERACIVVRCGTVLHHNGLLVPPAYDAVHNAAAGPLLPQAGPGNLQTVSQPAIHPLHGVHTLPTRCCVFLQELANIAGALLLLGGLGTM